MVWFRVRGNTPNRTDGSVSGSAKYGKEPDRTEPFHHYARAEQSKVQGLLRCKYDMSPLATYMHKPRPKSRTGIEIIAKYVQKNFV
jgi:hypothetical protein